MELTNHLLVVIDPTHEEQPALAQASVIAKKLNLDIELLICNYDSNLIEHKELLDLNDVNRQIDSYLKNHHETLEKLAEPLREQGFKVNCESVWDYPLHEGIIRQAIRSKPFTIIKDTHHHNKFSRAIFSSADWNLIMNCSFPMLFVKPDNLWSSPNITCSVNPVDDEQSTESVDLDILQLGKLLTHELDGKLNIYHAYCSILDVPQTIYPWGGDFNSIFTKEVDQQLRESHRQSLYKLADQLNVNHDAIVLDDGEAKYTLPNFVEKSKTDLLVMGSTCKSRFEQVFIGGTTESVLDEVDCDILVVHPQGFKSNVKKEYPALIR